MAMIVLKHGGTFFGHIKNYDWKGKFLVVEIEGIKIIGGKLECRIISWDNVESVYDEDYDKEARE